MNMSLDDWINAVGKLVTDPTGLEWKVRGVFKGPSVVLQSADEDQSTCSLGIGSGVANEFTIVEEA
jgi:hypothetical protein